MSHGGKNSDEKSFDRSAKIPPTSPSFVWMCVCVCMCVHVSGCGCARMSVRMGNFFAESLVSND